MNSWWCPVKASADCTVGENLNVSKDEQEKTPICRGWRDFRHTMIGGGKALKFRASQYTRTTISPLGLSKITQLLVSFKVKTPSEGVLRFGPH